MTAVPPAFVAACAVREFDFGRGPAVVRVEHPALPGRPILGIVEPGKPEGGLQEKIAACIVALHADFTQHQWDIL